MPGESRKLMGALALAAVSAVSMACGSSATPAAPSPAGGQATGAPAEPKVKTLVMAVEPPAREGNEGRHQSAPDNWQLKPIYEYLVGMASDAGKMVPELATDWTLQPDGKSFLFNLRKGVQFHNGYGEFTSKDTIPTSQEIVKQDSLAGASPFWRLVLDNIEPKSDYQVIYHLKRPDGNFLTSLSRFRGGMEIFSKADFDKNGPATDLERGPIAGTGPYQFKERAQGQYIRYERVPGSHWRVQADFPEYEFRPVREASTRLAGLLAGEIHVTQLPRDLQQQAERRGMRVVNGRLPGSRLFLVPWGPYIKDIEKNEGWQYPDSPLLDVRVRKALQHAVNLNELNKSFFGGKAEITTEKDEMAAVKKALEGMREATIGLANMTAGCHNDEAGLSNWEAGMRNVAAGLHALE